MPDVDDSTPCAPASPLRLRIAEALCVHEPPFIGCDFGSLDVDDEDRAYYLRQAEAVEVALQVWEDPLSRNNSWVRYLTGWFPRDEAVYAEASSATADQAGQS